MLPCQYARFFVSRFASMFLGHAPPVQERVGGEGCVRRKHWSTHCQVSYQLQLNSNISSPSLLRNFFVFNTYRKMRFSFHGGECTHCIDPTAAPPLLPSHLNQPNRMQTALPRAWGGGGWGNFLGWKCDQQRGDHLHISCTAHSIVRRVSDLKPS